MAAICLGSGLVVCAAGCSHKDSIPGGPGTGISPSSAMLHPGEKLRFQSDLPASSWEVVEGYEHGVISPSGEYEAPYFSPDSRTATIRANTIAGHSDAPVLLVPGEADSAACCGTTQLHLPALGEYVYLDELPVAVYRRLPVYPEQARLAGVQGLVLVMVLVCSSGQVIETRVIQSIPLLDDAAQEAARHWVFLPGRAGGVPIAMWFAIPMNFRLH